jgi:hypothetical protein
MAINVKLPEALVETAKRYGAIERRSVPKQIEYWCRCALNFDHPCALNFDQGWLATFR